MRACSKCGVLKPPEGFYSRGAECRPCACARVGAIRAADPEYYRNYDATRVRRPRKKVDREGNRRRSAKWYAANKHKARARDLVQKAIKSGRLTRPATCGRCGAGARIEAHHPDYSKPLDVVWLCDPCHSSEHRSRHVADSFRPRNTRWSGVTFRGETKSISDWAHALGVSPAMMMRRLKIWPLEEALTRPSRNHRRRA